MVDCAPRAPRKTRTYSGDSAAALAFLAAAVAHSDVLYAQEMEDATNADPAHYTVIFENDRVRVVRIRYGPRERSPMHSHKAGTYLYLTDGRVGFTLRDGSKSTANLNAGSVTWGGQHAHAVENMTDRPFEIFVVEAKAGAASVSAQASAADPDYGAAKREVIAAAEAYEEAARSLDVDRVVSFWTPDAVARGAIPFNGRESFRRMAAEIYPRTRVHDLTVLSREVEVRGYLAVEMTTYTETISRNGGEPMTIEGSFMAHWKRMPDGSWKIHRMVLATPSNSMHESGAAMSEERQ